MPETPSVGGRGLFFNTRTMKSGLRNLCLLLLCGCCLYACQGQQENPARAPEPPPQVHQAPPVAPQARTNPENGNSTVATVNGEVIQLSELNERVDQILQHYRDQIPPDQLDLFRPRIQQQALSTLIDEMILESRADARSISPDPEAINAKIDEIAARFDSPEEFEEQMKMAGMTRENLRESLGKELRIEALMEAETGQSTNVTEEDVEEYYQDNLELFQENERIRASHILLKVDPSADAEERTAKREELTRIHGLIESGSDFAELAQTHSDCPSGQRGGDLNFFEKGRMVPAFEEAAFSLEVGQVSGVIETDFGYHIIKLTDREPANTHSYEEVHDDLKRYLEQRKKQNLVRDFISGLRNSAEITYEPGYEPMQEPGM